MCFRVRRQLLRRRPRSEQAQLAMGSTQCAATRRASSCRRAKSAQRPRAGSLAPVFLVNVQSRVARGMKPSAGTCTTATGRPQARVRLRLENPSMSGPMTTRSVLPSDRAASGCEGLRSSSRPVITYPDPLARTPASQGKGGGDEARDAQAITAPPSGLGGFFDPLWGSGLLVVVRQEQV